MKKTKLKCCIPEFLVGTFQKGEQWVKRVGRLMTGSEDSTFSGAAG